MRSITVAEAQAFDQLAEERLGIPSLILMENAGRSVAEEALKMLHGKKKAAIICGAGNNGGDGFVAARHLLNAGIDIKVYLVGESSKLKAGPKINLNILMKMKQKVVKLRALRDLNGINNFDLVIDAIFGIGLKSEVRSPSSEVINLLNRSGKPILAVDVPSGLDADTGKVLGAAIKARKTVTFVAPKRGFSRNCGPRYCGKVIIRDIGIII
jgi:NAD(P)H-hydrate epimerase